MAERVMIVDDTPENLQVLGGVLEAEDWEVCVAGSGPEALAAIERDPPDIVLLDVLMPGMDGYEVCRRLKAGPDTRDIPVIFLTALQDEGNEATGLGLGACDFITKPFNIELVRLRIRNQLALRGLQARLARHAEELETTVRERTAELEEARRRLELLGEGKDILLKMLAFELSIPATGISGIAQLAINELPDDGRRRRWQGVIDQHGRRIAEILSDAEELGRFERSTSLVGLKPRNVVELVERSADQVAPHLVGKSLSFSIRKPPEPLFIQVDPELMTRALAGILKFSIGLADEAGRVECGFRGGRTTSDIVLTFGTKAAIGGRRASIKEFGREGLDSLTREASVMEMLLAEKLVELFGGSIVWNVREEGIADCVISLRNAAY